MWQVIEKLIIVKRRCKWPLKRILEAIRYVVKTGVQWRNLPGDYPPWQTVYWYFIKWKENGTLDLIHMTLLNLARVKMGRKGSPSVAIVDSKSASMTAYGNDAKGFDGNKKIKGRKRQLMVDTLGFIMDVAVHAANIHDSVGGQILLHQVYKEKRYDYHRLKTIYADRAYIGDIVTIAKQYKWELRTVKKIGHRKDDKVIPKSWIVERTIAWLDCFRRLARDYERLANTSEAMIKLAMIFILIKRIDC